MRTYAIGDIHGQLGKLQAAHGLIAADGAGPEDVIVHVGDLVDRGPDSRGVIDWLMAGQAGGAPWVVLKGNHDRMFVGFVGDAGHVDPGLRADLSYLHPKIGGGATLASYGVLNAADRPLGPVWAEVQEAVPPAHVAWLAELPSRFARDEALFVHAGIDPDVALAEQVEDALLWIREPFLSDKRDHGPLIVHGHTVVEQATHYGNRLNIDSGAAYGGPLSAVVIEGREAWLLTPAGRQPILP
ncbi:metallophosphoesterase family protein [Neogemmobacter tilapiae]|uniref:Serine/threonine protein phosphatase n=1 Tax=Neogemmobacter tilapiae TaxID=875041 RepID=A0A918WKZ2_9RHOB|nr:metallophosphoesterase family protein [Gemmobacter tilapiae]GHC55184.1 serine/threonine protein phosphatase [Gemmobacter tilapiae]